MGTYYYCPKCNEPEYEVRTWFSSFFGDTDIGECYACGYESNEGNANFAEEIEGKETNDHH